MKKLIFTLSVVVASLSSYAQFEKGTMMLGGSVGLEFTKNKDKIGGTTIERYKSTSFYLEPQFGYFVIDNLAVGAGLGLSTGVTKYNNSNDERYSYSSLTLEPFVRYYLPARIYFQGKFNVGTGASKYQDENGSDRDSYGISGVSLAAGYAIMLNSDVALEPQIGYYTQANKYDNAKDIDSGLYLRAAFQIYLRN